MVDREVDPSAGEQDEERRDHPLDPEPLPSGDDEAVRHPDQRDGQPGHRPGGHREPLPVGEDRDVIGAGAAHQDR
jgi:hypothetical protein